MRECKASCPALYEAKQRYAKNKTMVFVKQPQVEVFGIKLRQAGMKIHIPPLKKAPLRLWTCRILYDQRVERAASLQQAPGHRQF